MLILPELIIKKLLDELLKEVETNYTDTIDKTETILYRLFNGNTIGDFDFYEHSVKIMTDNKDKRYRLETCLMFDTSRKGSPTIHIVMPSESEGKTNSIGMGRSDEEMMENSDGSYQVTYGRSFSTKYNLAITSSNPYEVIIIYNLLKGIFIAAADSFEANGLQIPSYTGNDVNMDRAIIPNTYMRALAIAVNYDILVPSFISLPNINSINFNDPIVE